MGYYSLMDKRIVKSLPEVFSLRGNDYSQFVVKGGAAGMMHSTWHAVGRRMNKAAFIATQHASKKPA